MNRQTQKVIKNSILVVVLVTIATFITSVNFNNVFFELGGRTLAIVIYDFLIAYWGLAIVRRIMQPELRRYLIMSSGAMLFWMLDRSIKWYVASEPMWERFCWYVYYIPNLLLIYFLFMTSEILTEKNERAITRRKIILALMTFGIIVLVMTNEFHEIVFKVKGGEPYIHNYGYYTIALWMIVISVLSVIRLCVRREGGSLDKRVVAPLIVVGLTILFCLVVLIKEIKGERVYLEFTAGFCLFAIAFWESLIYTGLIPSNSDYEWCFNHSRVKARILDSRGRVVYESIEARSLTQDEIYELSKTGIMRNTDNTELVLAPIRGGSVVWERDVKNINESIRILSEATEAVREATVSLEESIRIEKKHEAIAARTRLYDLTFNLIEDKLSFLYEMINAAKTESSPKLEEDLKLIDIAGVYIKRRSNLLLLSRQLLDDFSGECRLCFKESFDNLKDFSIQADFMFYYVSGMRYEEADLLYTLFECIVEEHLDTLEKITAILSSNDKCFTLTINMINSREADYRAFLEYAEKYEKLSAKTEKEDREFTVSFALERRPQ